MASTNGNYSRYYVHEPHVTGPRYYVVEEYPSSGTEFVRSTIVHDDAGGWLLLTKGDAEEALQFFSQQTRAAACATFLSALRIQGWPH